MIKKGTITYPDYDGINESDKIEFFKKIKTNKLDAMSVIYKDVSPDIVKQASLFVSKMNQTGKDTALKGVYRTDYFTLYAHEYIKEGSDWILYLNFKVDMKEGIEFTKMSPLMRFAVASVNGTNYLAYEGSKKVFVVSEGFAGSFGYINLTELNDFMSKKPEKSPYKLSNISEEAYLADAPAQLFGNDTTYYRDGENFGFWMSFGTLVKFDEINFNNINIDGTPVALVDISYGTEAKFKKMLNAKSAGYACVLFNEESMLAYLLKQAKEYILGAKKEDLNKVCVEDLLKNVSQKGILGIVYEQVETFQEMYLPAFDYTSASVKDIVGPALCFIYDDEYIWMHYDKENKEIDFMSYKGDVFTKSDSNVSVTVRPSPTLSKVNKVNDNNFVLFTGFKNLEENNVLDIYFDGGSQILKSRNSKYAIDIEAFDDYYAKAVQSFNANFNSPKELVKTYGTNKYAFITGLIHYSPVMINDALEYELSVNTLPSIGSVIDAVDKKAHLNAVMLSHYGMLDVNKMFKAPLGNFIAFAQYLVKQITGKGPKPPKNANNPEMFLFFSNMNLFRNGYFTLKDNSEDKYVTLMAQRDVYTDFSMMDFSSEIIKIMKNMIKADISMHKEPDVEEIADAALAKYEEFARALVQMQAYSVKSEMTKKVKVCSTKERWVFDKVSDNMYVNNKPVDEICNHAILFEDAFQRTLKKYFDTVPEHGFISEYITAGKFFSDEHGYYIDAKEDLSSKGKVYLYNDLGMIAANMPPNLENNKYFKVTPKIIVRYNSKRNINGEDYDMFTFKAGYELEINVAYMEESAKKYSDGEPVGDNIKQYKGQLEAAQEQKAEDMNRSVRKGLIGKMKDAENKASLEIGVDKKFIPVGLESSIAYKQGKILTTIGGDEFYEPYMTDNGLRLNLNMYIKDVDVFETAIRNMILSDVFENIYDGMYIDKDIIDLQQIKVHKIAVDKSMNMGIIEFEFADIAAVINDELYQKGEPVVYTFDLDVDVDYIDDKTNKRVVFWDINIQYKTIYPIDAKRVVTNAEEILNNPNCFTVNHHIPVTIGIDNDSYIYDKKSQAIADNYFAFVNFTKNGS